MSDSISTICREWLYNQSSTTPLDRNPTVSCVGSGNVSLRNLTTSAARPLNSPPFTTQYNDQPTEEEQMYLRTINIFYRLVMSGMMEDDAIDSVASSNDLMKIAFERAQNQEGELDITHLDIVRGCIAKVRGN